MTNTARDIAVVFCLCFFVSTHAGASRLTTSDDGTLLLDGQKFRGIGVNYASGFIKHLQDPADGDYEQAFAELAANHIPFVRIFISGWVPSHMRMYMSDREQYFRLIDDVFRAAEQSGVGIVACLQWNYFLIPDFAGEHMNQISNPNSQTVALLRNYVKEFAARYKHSPALWAWECGNEFSLIADLGSLDNWQDYLPPTNADWGCPTTRTYDDTMTSSDVLAAFQVFAGAVREVDSKVLITTGNGLPRSYAESLRAWTQWQTLDSQESFVHNFELMNPDSYDMPSAHIYPDIPTNQRFWQGHYPTYDEIIGLCMDSCRARKKVFFMGEFGAPDSLEGWPQDAENQFHGIMEAIRAHKVPLAAVWHYRYYMEDPSWNITLNNSRGWMFQEIAAANAVLMKDSDGDGLRDISEDANEDGIVDPGETDPHNADSDGDGVNDKTELTWGYDPADPGSAPQLPVSDFLPLLLSVIFLGTAAIKSLK
jgi:hypothetical protein